MIRTCTIYIAILATVSCAFSLNACPWCVGTIDHESPAFFSDSCYSTPEKHACNQDVKEPSTHENEEPHHE